MRLLSYVRLPIKLAQYVVGRAFCSILCPVTAPLMLIARLRLHSQLDVNENV